MTLVHKQFHLTPDAPILECYIVIVIKENETDEFWFKAHDVAEYLGYKNPRQAIIHNIADEWLTNERDKSLCANICLFCRSPHTFLINIIFFVSDI
jgi:hypothetical protein